MLNKADVRDAHDRVIEKVPVPEWGTDKPVHERFLFVRSLTAGECDQMEESCIEARKRGAKVTLRNMRARLVALAACDERGVPVFTDSDVEWLTDKAGAPVNRLYAKAQELSGITESDLEELEKNLERIPADASS
jgi:hypothetical protein